MKNYIFGLHAVRQLLAQPKQKISILYLQSGRADAAIDVIRSLCDEHHIPMENRSRQELDKLTQAANHQGVVAVCATTTILAEADLPALLSGIEPAERLILILDGVQDPHNLGACFRSAEAAGVKLIIAPKDKSVGLTPTVSKVACGAAEIVPFMQVTNLARTIKFLKSEGVWVYGAAGEGVATIYHLNLSGAVAIVMGAEGAGLRRLTRELCDQLVNIPMRGVLTSLNVSVATGIFLFEAVRQRQVT